MSYINKCYYCDSILEIDDIDINISLELINYYICPVCCKSNVIRIPNSILKDRLIEIRRKISVLCDKIKMVN